MASESKKLLEALICEGNEEQLRSLKGILTIDYEAIEQHCKREDIPDESKYRDAVLMAQSTIQPVNYAKLSRAMGVSSPVIHRVAEEIDEEIQILKGKNKNIIAETLGVVAVTALFDPKTTMEKMKFTLKHVLGQEIEGEEGTPLSIGGDVFIINSDNRRQVAKLVQTGPLNQGERKILPENVSPDAEFIDDYVKTAGEGVKKLLENMGDKDEESSGTSP